MTTKTLAERDQQLIWHPYTQAKIAPLPVAISHGKGSYLFTEDGRKLFDGISSWWTNVHGHAHPYINEAIKRQVDKVSHVMFANFTHEPAVRLAELLTDVVHGNLRRVFYSDNGSTAVEVAIKMAYQYWQHRRQHRPYFIALNDSYHGDTFGSMSVSERSTYTKPFWPLLFQVLSTKTTCVSEVTDDQNEIMVTNFALDHLEEVLIKNRGKVSAIIVEPMLQGAGGMKVFTKGFLFGIKRLCVEHDVLLIADEAATGFYRTGQIFACCHEDVIPDIMCLAKGLTGGYLPLAVTLASESIFNAFLSDSKADALLHGHSFTGNPIAATAAVASIELLKKDETKKNIHEISRAIEEGITQFKSLPEVKNARSIGTVAIIELHAHDEGYLSNVAGSIARRCFEAGLFIRPLGNVIYLMPPMCSTRNEIEWALGLMKEAFC